MFVVDVSDESAEIIVSLNIFTTKTVNDANIDDKDEYLNIKEIIIQVKINNKLSWNDKAVKIPKYVATPFPPLKFNHTGNRCPKKANKQESSINSGEKCFVIIIGMYPLRASKISVPTAKYLFPVLRTLVAPILPDPLFLISLLVNSLVSIRPKGIEPHKYEKKITVKYSIVFNFFQKQYHL